MYEAVSIGINIVQIILLSVLIGLLIKDRK